jgi:hypothetical protein
MASFTRTDIPDRGRIVFNLAPTAAEIDVDVVILMATGLDIHIDVTRAQLMAALGSAGITGAQMLSFLRALRVSAVARAGGV